jgi:hypothetical protein
VAAWWVVTSLDHRARYLRSGKKAYLERENQMKSQEGVVRVI